MIEELKKYKYIKKSNFELSRDKAFDKINIKLWENSGILTAYYMGIIDELKGLAEIAKPEITLSRNDFLKMIEGLLDGDNVPDDVKAVIEEVFKEFNYKPNNKKDIDIEKIEKIINEDMRGCYISKATVRNVAEKIYNTGLMAN